MQKRNKLFNLTLVAVVALAVIAGCMTLPEQKPLRVNRVTRNSDEELSAKQVFIVADVSDSMSREGKFEIQKSLIEAFVAAMPNERYSASIVDFGGRYPYTFYGSQSEFNRELSSVVRPPQTFSGAGMAQGASQVALVGAQTPLEAALGRVRESLDGARGKAAVVVFTDGQATEKNASLTAGKRLVDSYRDEVCIHTVLIGPDSERTELLQNLAGLSDRGSYRTASDINSSSGMERFVRDVMFVERVEPVVRTVPVEPVKPPEPVVQPVKDSDGDGVPDDRDKEPDTPKGAQVDEDGRWHLHGTPFDLNKADIKPETRGWLNEAAKVFAQNPNLKVRVEGHTCDRGTEAYNQGLSERRANAVRDYLISRGVRADRLTAAGRGETEPEYPNTNEANRAKNRRVEMDIIGR